MYFINIFWGSENAVTNVVTVLDYAGIADFFAGLILLFIWIKKPKKALERRWTFLTIIFSLVAACLWIADSKFNHRLSFLQAQSFNKVKNDLEAKMRPRKLSPENTAALISCLKTAPKGAISVFGSAASTEAQEFAASLAEVLKISGFDVRPYPADKIPFMIYSPGVFLTCLNGTDGGQLKDDRSTRNAPKDPDFHPDRFLANAPPYLGAIQHCLWDIGISANASPPGNIFCEPGVGVIVVGPRF